MELHLYRPTSRCSRRTSVFLVNSPMVNPEFKMIQIMFETYNVPSLYLSSQSQTSLYAAGLNTGLVLDSGYGVTHSVAIHNGALLADATQTMHLGGKELTECMVKQLDDLGYSLRSTAENAIVTDIKEKICYVAMETESSAEDSLYELPDGNILTIGNPKFQCPEVLFQPSLIGKDDDGIHKMIHKTASKCTELQRELYGNIVLAGGNSLFKGMSARVQKEVANLTNMKVKVKEPQKYAAWIGGSMMASTASFQEKWVSLQEYEESGPAVVRKKCI